LTETTSIGVRQTPVSRTERPRRTVTVATPFGAIPVKVSEGPFGPPQIKPEFAACAEPARAHGVPVRGVISAALAAARSPRQYAGSGGVWGTLSGSPIVTGVPHRDQSGRSTGSP